MATMPVAVPLPRLLSAALRSLESEYNAAGAGRPPMPSLDLWANLLRAIGPGGADPKTLPSTLALSKRAVRSRLATAVRRGWLKDESLAPARYGVRLTPLGYVIAAQWPSLQLSAEDRWRAARSSPSADGLRPALEALVSTLPIEHPHYPASYGVADASITGGPGQDWKPVPRATAGPMADLPLSALLSQLCVAFAMAYEQASPVAFALATRILLPIPASGRPVRDLRSSPGLSALIRHGFIHATGSGHDAIAHLTPRGLAAQSAHASRVAAVEAEWQARFGKARIAALRQALHALPPTA